MGDENRAAISVVICTHNRSAFLARALEGLENQTMPGSSFETIVVDNASTDTTEQVAEGWKRRLPNLRYVFESRLGLSHARNTGAKLARTRFIAYLDDDAIPEPGWLDHILDAFESVRPRPFIVGGRVWLDWGGSPPDWLPRSFWSLYSFVDYGNEARFLTHDEFLAGANIAFRRDLLLELGGFDVRLGRKGATLISGEEAELVKKAAARDLPVYYEPGAAVRHFIPEERRRRRWLFKRVYWDGASQPVLDFGDRVPCRKDLWRRIRYDLKVCLVQLAGSGGSLILGRRGEAFRRFLFGTNRLGRLAMELKLLKHSNRSRRRGECGRKPGGEEIP